MTPIGQFSAVVAAAMPASYAGHIVDDLDLNAPNKPEIAAPFSQSRNIVLYSNDIHSLFLRDHFLVSSIAGTNAISITVETVDQSPAKLVQEFKRLSGLTWAQVAGVFEVSARAPFDWASGKPVSAKNHERLGGAVAAIRFIDRGSAEENRNLLLSQAKVGRTYLDLFRAGEFNSAQALAGKGVGRPIFEQKLTADAAKFNAPRHFGENVETGFEGDESEILPVSQPKLRRTKARRTKA
ncbi:hypothetical protein [Profundibacter sp.]